MSLLYFPKTLEEGHPTDILRWAGEEFDLTEIVVTASFQNAVLVHMAATAIPGVEIALLDTQYLFAQTTWFAEQLAAKYGLNLRIISPQPHIVPNNLWQTDHDECCRIRKIEPLNRVLSGKSTWITGLRRADSPTRAGVRIREFDIERNLVKLNPLASFSDEEMENYAKEYDLPVHPLTTQGYQSIGCWPCTRAITNGEDKRAGRWSGTTKTECGLHK